MCAITCHISGNGMAQNHYGTCKQAMYYIYSLTDMKDVVYVLHWCLYACTVILHTHSMAGGGNSKTQNNEITE